ncbi:hypothetical protein FHR32_003742 [Streptosporangium album]|uniref:Uncharacterized protein n=1 Tax=Streptosporangium album TaxID=47479 RepID=A0A7W7RWJ5_9ACTN|nr:hypothetical protein [Streptosporangium album]MBB4939437.1 hypothetical protein [Streptosporangium album]
MTSRPPCRALGAPPAGWPFWPETPTKSQTHSRSKPMLRLRALISNGDLDAYWHHALGGVNE